MKPTPTFALRRPANATLADLLPQSALRDVALVVGVAAFVGLSAQITIPLPFTPVPVTGQTFAVLLGSAAVGWRRGAAALALYMVAGLIGIPWFAGHAGGMSMATSPLMGYILGFIAAAGLTGQLAAMKLDRRPHTALGTMIAGNGVIYLVGATWLAVSLHLTAVRAIELGVLPFLPGDALKIAIASALLPTAWRVLGRHTGHS